MITNDVPNYREEMISLIEAYINNQEHVSQQDYFDCIDYLLDFNGNQHYATI